jgi:hypothetical protein
MAAKLRAEADALRAQVLSEPDASVSEAQEKQADDLDGQAFALLYPEPEASGRCTADNNAECDVRCCWGPGTLRQPPSGVAWTCDVHQTEFFLHFRTATLIGAIGKRIFAPRRVDLAAPLRFDLDGGAHFELWFRWPEEAEQETL